MLNRIKHLILGIVASVCYSVPTLAQPVSPTVGSGSTNTVVTSTNDLTITGGESQQNTLFHSFQDFSPSTASVLFQLDSSQSAIEYVIGRVTGANTSFIDGSLFLTGGSSPDLFLINPNGISFGPGASINVPGNFTASTADAVIFSDNLSFNSAASNAVPLLQVSAPAGLQYGQTANPLTVLSSALSVNSGNALNLVGGEVTITDGAQLAAPGGQLQIASISPNTAISFDATGSINTVGTTTGINTFGSHIANSTDFQNILFRATYSST